MVELSEPAEQHGRIARALEATGIAKITQLSRPDDIAAAVEALAECVAGMRGASAELLAAEAIAALSGALIHGADRVVDAAVKSARIRAQAQARALHRASHASNATDDAQHCEQLPQGVVVDNDLANAHRLSRDHGHDLKHCAQLGWLVWDGKCWAQNSTEAERRAHAVARDLELRAAQLLADAARAPSDQESARLRAQSQLYQRWAQKSQGEARIRACLAVAQSLEGIAIRVDDLDADPWLFTCANGTIDLRSGTLRPHLREDMITRFSPVEYVPASTAPTWNAFLQRVLPDTEVRAFVRRAIGYSLTGDTREQCLCVCHGGGANGKSTLTETVRHVLGDHAAHAATDTFMRVGARGADNDLARLRGARLVTAIESGEGRRLDEERVKQLTGGDTITARFLYREPFEFRPVMKIWLACNHRPEIHGTDDGVWRRIRLVPFDVQIPEQERDPELPAKLRAEAVGILAWAVLGCVEWQQGGLRAPAAVTASTAEWRAESDVTALFVDDRCVRAPHAKVAAGVLYGAFVDWCRAQGAEPMSQQRFGRRLAALGFMADRGNRGRYWTGLGLEAEGHDP